MNRKRIAILSLVVVAILATAISLSRRAHAQAVDKLAGTYRLLSIKLTLQETGETTDILGKAPKGYIMYGRDGRMMVLEVKDERPRPRDLKTMTDQEAAALFRTMTAYCGSYDFDGKTVTHHIDVSANEIWTGTNQVRHARFDGRKVILTTDPQVTSFGGKFGVVVTTWERVE